MSRLTWRHTVRSESRPRGLIGSVDGVDVYRVSPISGCDKWYWYGNGHNSRKSPASSKEAARDEAKRYHKALTTTPEAK